METSYQAMIMQGGKDGETPPIPY